MTSTRPFTRLVVPVDGSAFSESALPHAARLARAVGVPVTAVSYVDTDAARDEVVRNLRALVGSLPDDVVVDIAVGAEGPVVHTRGHVAARILDEAGNDALVCMTSHGRSGIGATVLGSVTEEVIRSAERPVLVVGPECGDPRFGDGMIVACLDGSSFAEQAVPYAADWADGLGAELWLVQVIDAEDPVPSDVGVMTYLQRASENHPGARYDVLHDDRPARALADLGERWRAAALVLATHGRSGWSRLALGSVAMNVVHHATCPVLLVGDVGSVERDTDAATT